MSCCRSLFWFLTWILVGQAEPLRALEIAPLNTQTSQPGRPLDPLKAPSSPLGLIEAGAVAASAGVTAQPLQTPSGLPQPLDASQGKTGNEGTDPSVVPTQGYRSGQAVAGPDPAVLLNACWTPAQLAGTDQDNVITRGLKPDRDPPAEWAIRAAEQALPPLAPGLRGSIRSVEPADPQARLVALTFDLCEQANERAGYDAELVDTLRRLGVKATFFAGGKWLRTHPEQAMQLMADPRFEIGNHAWTHANLRVVSGPEVHDQVLWTQAQYQVLRRELAQRPCAQAAGPAALSRVPEWPAVFRFPYGTCNQGSLEAAAGFGLPSIQWSVVTGDPVKGQSARAIAQAVLAGVRRNRGAIVVAHANGRGWNTARSLSLFIPELLEQGYQFVTVSELLAAGRPVAVEECYEVRPGDNRRYDALFGRGNGR